MKIDYHDNNKEPMLKTYYLVYVRKSSESEDKQMASIDNQLEVLQKLIAEKGLTVLETFTESQSAKKPGRKEFNRMLSLINKRDDIKGIVCWKLNRLSRNPVDSGTLQWLIQSGKIEEIVTPSHIYQDADSDFVMAIEGAQANRFIRDLREDSERGVQRKIENRHAPLLAPVEYMNNTLMRQGEKTISPHPVYFKLLRKIFDMALSQQCSVMDLLREARKMGIKTNRSNHLISRTQLYYVLKNPFYTGRFSYRGILYQGAHQPLITDSEYNAIQDYLVGRVHTMREKHDFAFTGKILCGGCDKGHFVGEQHIKKSGKIHTYYRCSMSPKGLCKQLPIKDTVLNKQIETLLGSIKISDKFVSYAHKWVRKTEENDKITRNIQYQSLRNELKDIEAKIQNLTDKWLSPLNGDGSLLGDEEYKGLKEYFLHQKQVVYQNLNNLDDNFRLWSDLTIETFRFAAKAQERWEKGTIEDKKLILTVIGTNFVVKDKKLKLSVRKPFQIIKDQLFEQKRKNQSTNDFSEAKLGTDHTSPSDSGWLSGIEPPTSSSTGKRSNQLSYNHQVNKYTRIEFFERVGRIELPQRDWKSLVLPLNHTRISAILWLQCKLLIRNSFFSLLQPLISFSLLAASTLLSSFSQ